jgi:chaperone modulatory protein CbpM
MISVSEIELVDQVSALDIETLRRWISLGWVIPNQDREPVHFDASDVVRVHLICELYYDLQIEEESMSVVLSLMDQLYAARRALNAIESAVSAQPDEIRTSIAMLVRRTTS